MVDENETDLDASDLADLVAILRILPLCLVQFHQTRHHVSHAITKLG